MICHGVLGWNRETRVSFWGDKLGRLDRLTGEKRHIASVSIRSFTPVYGIAFRYPCPITMPAIPFMLLAGLKGYAAFCDLNGYWPLAAS